MFPECFCRSGVFVRRRDCIETVDPYLSPAAAVETDRQEFMEIPMSMMNDLKKLAMTKLRAHRHRKTVSLLNSLPLELRKDIGWYGPNRRFE